MKPFEIPLAGDLADQILNHLEKIYPDHPDLPSLCADVSALFEFTEKKEINAEKNYEQWSQDDVILITYGNSIVDPDQPPLKTLRMFVNNHLADQISIVHILPFFPFSSDDGFAVMDYYRVNQALGQWKDVQDIAEDYRLMADLVINHTSSRAHWFENFKKGLVPGKDYYLTVEPECDLSHVVRPRTSPLLKEVQTVDGPKQVWCTFSHDQIDLNFQNPDVLLEFLNIIKFYLDNGVKVFRLDAVAFLWKETCTTCLHLDQTHEIIKLFRTVVEACDPTILIITETNVPSLENLSYLGNGDEAHVIYNFPLPPFLLNTLLTGDSNLLSNWLTELPEQPEGTTYLNFIASHDGIGLRPVEGYFSDDETKALIDCMESFGGKISTRALNDQKSNPYEINISLWDALKGTIKNGPDNFQQDRFLCAHAIMLCLKGIPAFYVHSLLATENDYVRRENLQSNRAVNRHIWDADKLYSLLNNKNSHHTRVFESLKELIRIRKQQPEFHPDSYQDVIQSDSRLVIIKRTARIADPVHPKKALLCVHNISDQETIIDLHSISGDLGQAGLDLTSGTIYSHPSKQIVLKPYQFNWIKLAE